MTYDPNLTLAELAVAHPLASRVFHREGLDYCCGGKRSLEEACRERGLASATILAEIESLEPGRADRLSWAERPPAELVRFIVDRYHSELRLELPDLVALADKVEDRHADKPTCPRGLAAHLRQVHEAVLSHLAKEEEILFPMIIAGMGARAGSPIQVMEDEHLEHARNLRRTRELAHDFVPPAEACTTWQALYLRLDNLEAELMEHIHLENNVLYPRALRGA
jgi:regulator of cell morphogenesis and NO signaling